MFGIGFSEIIIILVVAIMLFGSKGIPDIARFLGKTMAQLKNASDELKNEIQKSTKESGLDFKSITQDINNEVTKAKLEMNNSVNPLKESISEIEKPIEKAKEDFENLTGPIKRQL